MQYVNNWDETRQRFKSWWKRTEIDRPMINVIAVKKDYGELNFQKPAFSDPEDLFLNVDKIVEAYRYFCETHVFKGDAFPNLDINLGAGSMALYLGCEPIFTWESVWFKGYAENGWDEVPSFRFDPENYWWKKHIQMAVLSKKLAGDDFPVNIPDIVENIDILSSIRGAQNICYDLVDRPDTIKERIRQLDDLYFKYYNEMYDVLKMDDGSSVFTFFQIWGPGRTAKLQCDFCAMMSPGHFREMIVPSLRKQCIELDNSVYHLDGPDAVKHLDALLEIEELDAVQWTPGDGKADGGSEIWYPIYDKVVNADKSLWINVTKDNTDDMIEASRKLTRRYGSRYLYLHFPEMEESDADRLVSALS